MTTVSLHFEHGEVWIGFRYNPGTVEALKELHCARWDPDRKRWHAPDYRSQEIEDLFEELGYEVIWIGRQQSPPPEPPPPPPLPGQQAADAWLSSLPEHLRHPVYRAVIRVLHPDVGGDTAAAQSFNAAWDRVRGAA